ncbi:hypothetical protein A3715_10540 [Oleiphilus sp. HI0009]|nr:hypothetical protein A3715_10540 [Oleiphilus sp. HI0009]
MSDSIGILIKERMESERKMKALIDSLRPRFGDLNAMMVEEAKRLEPVLCEENEKMLENLLAS